MDWILPAQPGGQGMAKFKCSPGIQVWSRWVSAGNAENWSWMNPDQTRETYFGKQTKLTTVTNSRLNYPSVASIIMQGFVLSQTQFCTSNQNQFKPHTLHSTALGMRYLNGPILFYTLWIFQCFFSFPESEKIVKNTILSLHKCWYI